MQVIDVDSHVSVVKGLEDSPFQITLLPDGGHLMEFSGARIDLTPPHGKTPRPHKPPIDIRTTWDLNRRLEDLDQEGIDRQVLIFHTSHVFYGADPKVAVQTARKYDELPPGTQGSLTKKPILWSISRSHTGVRRCRAQFCAGPPLLARRKSL